MKKGGHYLNNLHKKRLYNGWIVSETRGKKDNDKKIEVTSFMDDPYMYRSVST